MGAALGTHMMMVLADMGKRAMMAGMAWTDMAVMCWSSLMSPAMMKQRMMG